MIGVIQRFSQEPFFTNFLAFELNFLDKVSFLTSVFYTQEDRSLTNHLLPYTRQQQVWKNDFYDEKAGFALTTTATFQGHNGFLDFCFSQCGFGGLSAYWILFV